MTNPVRIPFCSLLGNDHCNVIIFGLTETAWKLLTFPGTETQITDIYF